MRKFFVISILFIIIVFAGAAWALNSAWFSVQIARRAAHHWLPVIKVTELSVGRQQFFWPGDFSWDNIRIGIEYKGRTYLAAVPRLKVSGVSTIFRDRSLLNISLAAADVFFTPGEARGIKADLKVAFERRKLLSLDGPVTAETVKWDKLEAGKIAFHLSRGVKDFEFSDISATAYGGTVAGHARFVAENLVYSADLSLEGIETARLAELNEQFSLQVIGRAKGHLRLSGQGESLSALESDWAMLDGAKVNASLLSALAQYIPQSQEKKRLDELIRKGGQLPVEVLAFKVKSDSPRHLGGEVKLKSREVNLELNITNDINTDGTLLSLLSYWKTLFK